MDCTHLSHIHMKLPTNPNLVKENDIVLFKHKGKLRVGKAALTDRYGYCYGYYIIDIKTEKRYYPYNNDVTVITDGILLEELCVKICVVDK